MNKADSGEFFNAPIENTFSEYKVFTAEQYFPVEITKPPAELTVTPESYAEAGGRTSRQSAEGQPDLNDLTKRYNELNGGESGVGNTTAPDGAAPSTAAAGTSAAGSTGSAAAGSSAGAATIGAASTAAVAIAVVFLAVSLFPFIGKLISFVLGTDYAVVTLNIDEVIARDAAFSEMSASDFRLELTDGVQTKSLPAKSGEQTYLFTGLKPDTEYVCNLLCDHPDFAADPVCYTEKITTSATAEVTAVCDKSQIFAVADEETRSATVYFAAYISDCFGEYDNYFLYITDAGQSEKELLFASSDVDPDGYFRIMAENIRCQEILVTIAAQESGSAADETVILEYRMPTELPDEWLPEPEKEPPLILDDSSLASDCTDTSIIVEGKLLSLDNAFRYTAVITQSDENGVPLASDEEATLWIDTEKMTFSVSTPARYGVKYFSFTLTAVGEDGAETVCISSTLPYDADQSFTASYVKVGPQGAALSYSADGITVTVDTKFRGQSQNSFYRLTLTDGNGNRLDEYAGTEKAVFFLSAADLPEQINFRYADCAVFAEKEIVYQQYDCNAVKIDLPTADIGTEFGFDGEFFTIDYTVGTDYDLSRAELMLSISRDGIISEMSIPSPERTGRIALQAFHGEPGDIMVTPTLRFYDNQTNGTAHELSFDGQSYTMLYDFAVSEVSADITTAESIPVRILFAAGRVPSSYQICVKINGTDTLLPASQSEYAFALSSVDEAEITVSLADADGNDAGYSAAYTINKAQAQAALTEKPIYSAANPADTAITYNSDGTVNVYRKVRSTVTVVTNENILLNARLFGFLMDGDDSQTKTGPYDCFTDGDYAVMENLPKQSYYFTYYYAVRLDGVIYTVEEYQYPSGSILSGPGTTATKSETDAGTEITISFGTNVSHMNIITINGTDYTFDGDSGSYENPARITLPQGEEIGEVTIYIAGMESLKSLNALQEDGLETKGEPYEAVTVSV